MLVLLNIDLINSCMFLIILIRTYIGTVTAMVMMLFAGITVTGLVFVIIAYHRNKLHQRNQETPQGIVNVMLHVHMFGISILYIIIYTAASYEEPYDWAVSRLPQTEPEMEQCPAYGVLTK